MRTGRSNQSPGSLDFLKGLAVEPIHAVIDFRNLAGQALALQTDAVRAGLERFHAAARGELVGRPGRRLHIRNGRLAKRAFPLALSRLPRVPGEFAPTDRDFTVGLVHAV